MSRAACISPRSPYHRFGDLLTVAHVCPQVLPLLLEQLRRIAGAKSKRLP